MKKLLLAGLVAGAWSSGALAADLGPYTPPPPPRYEPEYGPVHDRGYNWHGLYLGANAGYGWGNSNSADYSNPGLGIAGTGAFRPDGWYGGGQVGFNTQFNWLVLGVEADIQGSDIGDTTVLASPGAFTEATTDIDWFSTVRGRIGVATGPTLIYFTGGWAFADVSTSVNSSGNFGSVAMSSDEIKSGYTLGGGLEWAFAPNWSLKTEYLYVDFGEDTFSTPVGTFSNETDFHTARVGINYRF